MQQTTFQLGDIEAELVLKDIKNVHLSVYPPNGRVRIAAPRHMNPDTIRVYAISKLTWIKQQQKKFQDQEREAPRDFIDRESHYVWGKRYLIKIVERDAAPQVTLLHKTLELQVRPGTDTTRKDEILSAWYREEVKKAAPLVVAKWEPLMRVKVQRIRVQQMKTKWGSCTPSAASVRLNSELAKKPRECLEYIIVHEMAHLLEPTHNQRFTSLMDFFLPNWQHDQEMLNRLPVRHERWEY